MKMKLTVEGVTLVVELTESAVARALLDVLPREIRMSRWGDEYYGAVGLGADNDPETKVDVPVGTVAYWPDGDALCIFFGPTPMSDGPTPRAASAVTVLGRVVEGDPGELRPFGQSVSATLEAG